MLAHYRMRPALALLALASVLLPAASHAAFQTTPPPIKFTVSKSAIDFGAVQIQKSARETFNVVNDSACAMHLNVGSDATRDFATMCFGLTNLGEVGAGSSIGCRVDFSPQKAGPQSKVLSVTLSYGRSCKSELHAALIAEHDAQRKPIIDKRDALNEAGPNTQAADTALKTELLRITTAIGKLKTEELALKVDSPEIVKSIEEERRLTQMLRDRVGKLNEQWDRLKAKGPNFDVVKNLLAVKTSKFKLEDSRLETAIAAKSAEQKALVEQQRIALAELRKGRCRACSFTKSEYERSSKVATESWDAHVDRNGIRNATPEDLAAKKKEYDDKIAAVVASAAKLGVQRAGLKKQHDADLADLKAKTKLIEDTHAKRLDELQAEISAVRKDMSKQIVAVEARTDALRVKAAQRRTAIKKEISALEAARTIANTDHKGKVAKIAREHATALAKLDGEVSLLKTRLSAAERTLDRNLLEKKTLHVKLSGEGANP